MIKKILLWTLAILITLIALVYITGNGHLFKGAKIVYLKGYKSAYIHDYVYFDTHDVEAPKQARILEKKEGAFEVSSRLQHALDTTESVAFLILQRDTLIYEDYYKGYTPDSLVNSFSMAKSVVTLLTQIAIQEGKIGGWGQMAKSFIPELKGEYADKVQLRHLSTMTAGMEWDESYKNPFGVTAKAYYGSDANQVVLNQAFDKVPGAKYEYHSGETQLLGMVLSRAVGMTVSEYAQEKLWKPLGMEHNARWHLDKANGNELLYCCLNAAARDFAKLGLLVLHHGKYNGVALVDSAFLHLARKPFLDERYGYSFWLNKSHGTPIAYYRGANGQYIIVVPEYDLVILRLGYKTLPQSDGKHHDEFHIIVDEVIAELKRRKAKEMEDFSAQVE